MSQGDRQRIAAYAVCVCDDHVLAVRASERTRVPGWWFLPGGGVDFGEPPAIALAREINEETGLAATSLALVGVLSDVRRLDEHAKLHSVRLIYTGAVTQGELRNEHEGTSDLAAWIPLAELGSLDVAPYVLEALELVSQLEK